MKQIRLLTICLLAAVLPAIHNASGQVANGNAQTVAPRSVTTRSAPAPKAVGVVNTRFVPSVAPRPAMINPRVVYSSAPPVIAQPAIRLPQQTYSQPLRTSNPNLAMVNMPRVAVERQVIVSDAAAGQTGLRTLAAMQQRRGLVTRDGNISDPATRQNEIRTLATMREHRGLVSGQAAMPDTTTRDTELRTPETLRERRVLGSNNQTLATIDPQLHVKSQAPEKDVHGKNRHNKKDRISYGDAFRRHWHEWHDRNWWHDNCDTIVFVNTGYYFLDGSYWYPAWGYDPLQSYYDYDGPIYTYGDLLPDEVIANVQTALQEAGYYFGAITGSLSIDMRAAIANFQRDYGLQITGAIDEATVEALGLY